MFGKRGAVHVGGDEGIGVESFLDRYAANKGRDFDRDFVEAAKHDVLAGGLDPRLLQDITQAWTGKAGGAYGTLAPLNAGDLGALQAATVAGAFERVDDGVVFEF